MPDMDRRGFIRAAGVALAAGAGTLPASTTLGRMFEDNVDESLFKTINRVKDPGEMTGLELHHVPVLSVPDKVKPGEPFMVDVKVGKELHPVSEAHWISEIVLLTGNEPLGSVQLFPSSVRPEISFLVSVDKPVTLVAQIRCNLHGLWEGFADVKPA